MIIQCDKCMTKFHLDDSRVTGAGIRVRCTKCQNVFVVPPPPVADVPLVEIAFGSKPSAPSANGAVKGPGENLKLDFSREDTPESGSTTITDDPAGKKDHADEGSDGAWPSFDDIDFGSHPLLSKEEGSALFPPKDDPGTIAKGETPPPQDEGHHDDHEIHFDDMDFGFDEPVHKDETGHGEQAAQNIPPARDEAISKPPAKDEWCIFAADTETVDTATPSVRQDAAAEEKPSASETPEVRVYPKVSGYSSPGKEDFFNIGAAQEKPENDTDSVKDVVEFSTVLADAVEKEAGPPAGTEPDEPHIAPKTRSGRAAAFLIAAVVVVVGAVAIYYSGAVDKIARGISQGHEAPAKKTISIDAVSGYMAENKNFGKLFVIQGSIKNLTDEPQEIKKVKGVIYNSSGESIAERLVTPGRIVSADDIKNLPKEELLRSFRDASKGIIPPKGTLPVMVLFTDTPGVIAECSIDVIR